MDLGTGVAVSGVAVSFAAVAITAIKVRSNGKSEHSVCPLHSGIDKAMTLLTEQVRRIEEHFTKALETIQQDIKSILKTIGDKDD